MHEDVKPTLTRRKAGKTVYHVPFPAIGEAYLVAHNKGRVDEIFNSFHSYVKKGFFIPEGIRNTSCYNYAYRLLKSTAANKDHKNGWGEQYMQSTDALILACALSDERCTHFLTSDKQINVLNSLDLCAKEIRDEMGCGYLNMHEIQ